MKQKNKQAQSLAYLRWKDKTLEQRKKEMIEVRKGKKKSVQKSS